MARKRMFYSPRRAVDGAAASRSRRSSDALRDAVDWWNALNAGAVRTSSQAVGA